MVEEVYTQHGGRVGIPGWWQGRVYPGWWQGRVYPGWYGSRRGYTLGGMGAGEGYTLGVYTGVPRVVYRSPYYVSLCTLVVYRPPYYASQYTPLGTPSTLPSHLPLGTLQHCGWRAGR